MSLHYAYKVCWIQTFLLGGDKKGIIFHLKCIKSLFLGTGFFYANLNGNWKYFMILSKLNWFTGSKDGLIFVWFWSSFSFLAVEIVTFVGLTSPDITWFTWPLPDHYLTITWQDLTLVDNCDPQAVSQSCDVLEWTLNNEDHS